VARRGEPIYTFAATVIPAVVRKWVHLECRGFEHLPADGPVIVASNHISYFDPLCLGSCVHGNGRMVKFLAKSELFSKPVVGPVLAGARQIPVKRNTRDAAEAMEHAIRALKDGGCVAVYPEGTTTRNTDFSPGPAKSGVSRLALLTGAPVLPVGQWGAHLLFAQGRYGPFRRGIRAVVSAGPLLEIPHLPDPGRAIIRETTDRIMRAIGEQVEEAKAGWSPPSWYRPKALPPSSPTPSG
jgi:1-acyl-sn-glycerol-3-phosphate acyltransferase